MFKRLESIEQRFRELERLVSSPQVIADSTKFKEYARELAKLSPIVEKFGQFKKINQDMKGLQEIIEKKDEEKEFIELAKKELESLQEKADTLRYELTALISQKEPDKDIIVEIRAGTGGQEASLFAADLFRMYSKYAAKSKWKLELIDSHPTEVGGFKEIIFSLKGKEVYKRLKYESGVHRVQRVPSTEASGRIHTSAVTVAVLPEPQETELKIDPNDLRIDVFRSSGPGGQSVNTADSAVRITHIPTGIVVSCQDERSQLKNKMKAMRVLRARLLSRLREEQQSRLTQARKLQVGSGDRSEKIRTYNFPNRRVTDHRIDLTLHRLDDILEGNLDEIVSRLIEEDLKRQTTT
jgi:peptide chain release factor 1